MVLFSCYYSLAHKYTWCHYIYFFFSKLFHWDIAFFGYLLHLDVPVTLDTLCNPMPAMNPHTISLPPIDPLLSSHKCPAGTPGLVSTNAAFLIPDHIWKKFTGGWNVHVPLTYLTDKGCLLQDKSSTNTSDTIDGVNSQISALVKSLPNNRELDLSFDEWHQAWHHLLDLIKTYLPDEFLMWEVHYAYILNNHNHAESWPLFLAYDAEIWKRAVQLPINPSQFSIGIWNSLESCYAAKRSICLFKLTYGFNQIPRPLSYHAILCKDLPSIPNNNIPNTDTSKPSQYIFCGDSSKSHSFRNCSAIINVCMECHRLPWGFLEQPAPAAIGMGFYRHGAWVS